jgi:hypothetical protein
MTAAGAPIFAPAAARPSGELDRSNFLNRVWKRVLQGPVLYGSILGRVGARLRGTGAMAKNEAASANQEAKYHAFNALRPPKPRSVVIDGLVFIGGFGALLWVLCAMAPN